MGVYTLLTTNWQRALGGMLGNGEGHKIKLFRVLGFILVLSELLKIALWRPWQESNLRPAA